MGIDDQQQGGIRPRSLDTADLGATIHQHAQATALAVVPLLDTHLAGVGRKPGDVLDPDRLIVVADQKA
ncbi:hypothetical protein D3C73_1396230 [compost metagenome]